MKKTLLLVLLLITGPVFADAELDKVRKSLQSLNIKSQPDSVTKSKVPGFYEVVYGAQVFYITADAKYMIEGDVWDLKRRVNLTEEKRNTGRVKAVSALDEKSLLIFAPKEKKYSITVFTDIDCGYCRKLHNQMAEYNDLGIEIRYAAYPRSGLQTESYFKAVAVWCAVDKLKAMNFAKGGAKLAQLQQMTQVEGDTCKKSIEQHMSVAREVGVTGTPTIVMEDGSVLPGYVPPARLLQELRKLRKS
ncbi:MAG: DsbC family protein [Gammaproteobacteria bacterium]|nr:DsbC family protein [Gammaproteobacteria bacterium]MDH5801065.1 DsbC family protein [Gammaproteobacteria bacterium]